MNILLTGGTGFIGKNLIELLGGKYNIFAPPHKKLELLDAEAVRNCIKNNKIDVIIHAANRGGGRDTKDMRNVVEYNTRMFFNIARDSRFVKKIINLGSGAEYGKQKDLIKVKEDKFDSYVPLESYGFSKYVCSKYIENCKNIINLRLFGVFGKYEGYEYRFISNAIVKNLLGLPIIINQNVYFDYLYANDLVKIIEHFIAHESRYKFYNAVTGKTIDLITIANKINEISAEPSKIFVKNPGLNREYSGDNSRLSEELNAFGFTPFDRALSELYAWYKANLGRIDRDMIVKDEYIKHCRTEKQV